MEDKIGHVSMDVWGKFALFTRPECKVERYSYEVPTPSSLRNLLQSIYWHPTFDYEVTGIQVYNRVKHRTITRNELSSVMRSGNALKTMESVLETGEGPSLSVPASMPRQQRCSTFLCDVYYTVYAAVVPKPNLDEMEEEYNLTKIIDIFKRRVEHGQSWRTPYLGMKECTAFFGPHERESQRRSVYDGTKIQLGRMFFDADYSNPDNVRQYFYYPTMENGYIRVPSRKEVMGHGA